MLYVLFQNVIVGGFVFEALQGLPVGGSSFMCAVCVCVEERLKGAAG